MRRFAVLGMLLAACAGTPQLASAAAPTTGRDSAAAAIATASAAPAAVQVLPAPTDSLAEPTEQPVPWPITFYESRDAARAAGGGIIRTGALWVINRNVDEWLAAFPDVVAPRYLREHRHVRPPLALKMPDGSEFVIDSRAYTKERGYYGDGWVCTGVPPLITLSPSVNIVGSYHGWVGQGGVAPGWISNDVEGRQFPHAT